MKGETPVLRIQRFPRLPLPKVVAELAQKAWKPPKFSAEESNGNTKFIFTVPIQSRFRRENSEIYKILFKRKKIKWIQALEKVYPEARRGKRIAEFMDTLLYKLFSDALLILNTDTHGFVADHTPFKIKFSEDYQGATARRKGRRSNPRRAEIDVRLWLRYDALHSQTENLRHFLDQMRREGIDDEEQLRRKVAAAFGKEGWTLYVTSGAAFERLPANSSLGTAVVSSSLGGRWAPWQLAVGIIRCQEGARNRGKMLSPWTIFKAIMHGKKLRSDSSNEAKGKI